MKYTLEMHETFSTVASAQHAFDYIVDFSHIDEWDNTIVTSEKVGESEVQLGTRFNLLFAMGKRKLPINYEITKFNSPSKAVLTGTSKNFTAVDTVTVMESNQGCSVDWHAKIVFSGLSALVVPLISNKIKAAGIQTIRDLKKILDSLESP